MCYEQLANSGIILEDRPTARPMGARMTSSAIYLYDTTLRDGAQTQGVDFPSPTRWRIAARLDRLGIDYVEGGWPGANPTDDAFFAEPPALARARLVRLRHDPPAGPQRRQRSRPGGAAAGRARRLICWSARPGTSMSTWRSASSRDENIAMIGESVAQAVARAGEVMFDAEHFFDGYKANPGLCAATASRPPRGAGARWIVLCDTNGGTLPHEVERIVGEVARAIPGSRLGIHCHNDTENAVANSLAARARRRAPGAGHAQRPGRALRQRQPGLADPDADAEDWATRPASRPRTLGQLTHVSRLLDERLNRAPEPRTPPMSANPPSPTRAGCTSRRWRRTRGPTSISSRRWSATRATFVVSDQAGRANILARFREIGLRGRRRRSEGRRPGRDGEGARVRGLCL